MEGHAAQSMFFTERVIVLSAAIAAGDATSGTGSAKRVSTLSWKTARRQAVMAIAPGATVSAGAIASAAVTAAVAEAGSAAAEQAAETARKTFQEGGAGESLPTFTVTGGQVAIVDALVGLGFAKSKGEARRLIAGGGARVNGEKVSDDSFAIWVQGHVRVSAGKKQHGLIVAG